MRRQLAAGALAAVLAGCGVPSPTPVPSQSAPPAASATLPPATCGTEQPSWWKQWKTTAPDGSQVPVAITLTCEGAVAAAWSFVNQRPGVASAEFQFGMWCWPEQGGCPAAPPNVGYVIFHMRDGTSVVVTVKADSAGVVTAGPPTPPIQSPSPS